MKLSRTDFHIW